MGDLTGDLGRFELLLGLWPLLDALFGEWLVTISGFGLKSTVKCVAGELVRGEKEEEEVEAELTARRFTALFFL